MNPRFVQLCSKLKLIAWDCWRESMEVVADFLRISSFTKSSLAQQFFVNLHLIASANNLIHNVYSSNMFQYIKGIFLLLLWIPSSAIQPSNLLPCLPQALRQALWAIRLHLLRCRQQQGQEQRSAAEPRDVKLKASGSKGQA